VKDKEITYTGGMEDMWKKREEMKERKERDKL